MKQSQQKSNFSFDGVTHTYKLGNRVIPSVTQALSEGRLYADFSLVPDKVMQRSQNYGIALHKACELYDKGILDNSTLSVELAPPLCNWIQFKIRYKITWLEDWIERTGYSEKYQFGFTLDRVGQIGQKLILIDIFMPNIFSHHFA